MPESHRPSIRLTPRRHDAGAALMLKFRPKDGSAVRNRRLGTGGLLRVTLLPIICVALALAVKEQQDLGWMKSAVLAALWPSEATNTSSTAIDRIAPASPVEIDRPAARVTLTHIDDSSEGASVARPASLSREIRVAEEELPVDPPSAAPALRAALHLGDQPLRSQHR